VGLERTAGAQASFVMGPPEPTKCEKDHQPTQFSEFIANYCAQEASEDEPEDDDDDDDQSDEYWALVAKAEQLEADLANKKFRAEAVLLRAEIKHEMSYEGPYWDPSEYEGEYDLELARSGEGGQRVAEWVAAVEAERPWAKRRRAQMEKDEEQPPSPPTKRAKLEFPCVVPGCGKGYKSKASLQRHVFASHERVDDPVARRACRLLWGEKFEGRLEEINRRYGGY
jgi:hypothetical protein